MQASHQFRTERRSHRHRPDRVHIGRDDGNPTPGVAAVEKPIRPPEFNGGPARRFGPLRTNEHVVEVEFRVVINPHCGSPIRSPNDRAEELLLLIIDADDVKCSHGATVGQIDEEALFYLRARGIEETKARLMMMNAFTHEVVNEIKLAPLRDRIDELVDKRLKGELARCHECAYQCDC